ncbi:MAG: peptidylprolyl isomerase, partial [Gammaproteobacteria bacterium]
MKRLKNLLFLPIFIAGTVSSAEITLDRIAIIVGDGVVLESQVNKMLNTFKQRAIQQNQGDRLPPDNVLIEQVRERLIIEELQLQSGRRAGVRIGDAELNEYVADVAGQNNLSVDAFIDTIEAQGESYPEFREQLRKELIIQRVQRGKVGSQIIITDQELDRFLETEEAKAQLLPELQLNQILVKDLDTANALKEDLVSGKDFIELAKLNSIASNASSGGDLGWRKANDLPDLFFDAVNKQPRGFISEPLKSGAGYHLIQLTDKRGPFVEYQDQWKVRHILMTPTKLRDETFTKQELQDVRERLINGEEFSLLAKEFSEDPGS